MRLPRERPQSTYFDEMQISTIMYVTTMGVMRLHAKLRTSKFFIRRSRIKSVNESIFIKRYIERRVLARYKSG